MRARMVSLNWSMAAIGYPAHRRGARPTVGLSHMNTYDVLNVAEHLGLAQGWLQAEGNQPQLEGMRVRQPLRVDLRSLLADRRVVMTDGLASGSLCFVAAGEDAGEAPTDRPLGVWADELGRPWIEVVDNELAYWGGLDDAQVDVLMAWFLAQRPLGIDWRRIKPDPRLAGRLRQGLFSHGWLRNLALVETGRRASLELWGGIHGACLLDHAGLLTPSRVSTGLDLTLGDTWRGEESRHRCPLGDDNGKMER